MPRRDETRGAVVEADCADRAALAPDLHRADNNMFVFDEILFVVYPTLESPPTKLFVALQAIRAKLINPPRSSRKTQHCYGRTLDRPCNLVESFLKFIEYFRRVSTRCGNGNVVGEEGE